MIRILWLYKYMSNYDFDHHLHMSFARFIAGYPGVYLKAYGPGIHLGYPNVMLCEYSSRLSIQDLYKAYKFDVVIINTKSRAFEYYNPHAEESRGCWIPKGFEQISQPKVVIEEDYHYEKNDEWYQEMNIDLILQRHYSQSLRQEKVKMKFLPFSVDIATFNSWSSESPFASRMVPLPFSRKKQFGFIGSHEDGAYKMRKAAITILVKNGLGVQFPQVMNGNYVRALREYIGYVSCGSTYEICAAKNFEIMATGGVLFTNKFKGVDLLFPEKSYLSYKNDCSDVLEKANDFIYGSERRIVDMAKESRECIYSKHTHEIRIKQLLEILENL